VRSLVTFREHSQLQIEPEVELHMCAHVDQIFLTTLTTSFLLCAQVVVSYGFIMSFHFIPSVGLLGKPIKRGAFKYATKED